MRCLPGITEALYLANMESSPTVLLSYFLILFSFEIKFLDAEFSNEDCASLGFNKANLLCSVCDQLGDFNLEILK